MRSCAYPIKLKKNNGKKGKETQVPLLTSKCVSSLPVKSPTAHT